MQKQVQQQVSVQQKPSQPVEIDAQLLAFVSGAAPKAGWTEPELVVDLSSSSDAPKAGW